MSEYDALRKDVEEVGAAMARYAGAVNHHADAVRVTLDQLWADNAELRDELHALANRVETLTRARLTEPAEVAEAMVLRHGVPCSECGVPVYVDRRDPQLPSPIRDAADGALHTCRASA